MTTKSQLYINYCSISSRKVLFDHVDALAQLKEGPCFRRNLFVVAVVVVVFFFNGHVCAVAREIFSRCTFAFVQPSGIKIKWHHHR